MKTCALISTSELVWYIWQILLSCQILKTKLLPLYASKTTWFVSLRPYVAQTPYSLGGEGIGIGHLSDSSQFLGEIVKGSLLLIKR